MLLVYTVCQKKSPYGALTLLNMNPTTASSSGRFVIFKNTQKRLCRNSSFQIYYVVSNSIFELIFWTFIENYIQQMRNQGPHKHLR